MKGRIAAAAERAKQDRLARAKAEGIRHCKHCGCSEFDPCHDKVLQDGCAWVSEDECSVCRPDLRGMVLAIPKGPWTVELVREALELARWDSQTWLDDHNLLLKLLDGHPDRGMIAYRLGRVWSMVRLAHEILEIKKEGERRDAEKKAGS